MKKKLVATTLLIALGGHFFSEGGLKKETSSGTFVNSLENKTTNEKVGQSHIVSETKQVSEKEAMNRTSKRKDLKEVLSKYSELKEVMLKNEEQKIQYRESLKDARLHRKAYLELARVDRKESLHKKIADSLLAIDFLIDSLEWKDNPEREQVKRYMKSFLYSNLIDEVENLELRRAIAGDMAELYSVLKDMDPELASEIKTNAQGTRLAQIIKFADDIL